jgi:polygalacturonase
MKYYKIRPQNYYILIIIILSFIPQFSRGQDGTYLVREYGAKGDGKTYDTKAIQKTIDACAEKGGGTVFFDAGTYLTGTIKLKSNITLNIGPGAVIKGSGNIQDYKEKTKSKPKSLIWGDQLKNVTIQGPGIIDGNGEAFHDLSNPLVINGPYFDTATTRQGFDYGKGVPNPDGTVEHVEPRPFHTISFGGCENIRLESFTLNCAPFWAVEFNGCNGVSISNIRIRNNQRMVNSDGINFKSCRNVLMNNCDIVSGDDAVAISSSKHRDPRWHKSYPGPCKDIVINNCILNTNSRGIMIAAHDFEIERIKVSNTIFQRVNRGVYISSTSGNIRDIIINNCIIKTHIPTGRWWGTGEPAFVKSMNEYTTENIIFSDIRCIAEGGIILWSEKHDKIRNLTFRNFNMTLVRGENVMEYGGNFDFRGGPLGIFKHDIPGIYAQNISHLKLHNFRLKRNSDLPNFYKDAFEFMEMKELKMTEIETIGYDEKQSLFINTKK